MEDGFRRDGDVVVEIGHPVATLVDDLSVLDHGQSAAWTRAGVPFREDFVDLLT